MTPQYYSFLPLNSHNAFLNFVWTRRNIGKTCAIPIWGLGRFLKTGKKFMYYSRTKVDAEARTDKPSHLFKPWILKKYGLSLADVKIDGDVTKGRYAYIRRGDTWVDFCEFGALSAARQQRSNDDDDYNLFFLDEAFVEPHEVAQFRGDEARALFDLLISKKREKADFKAFIIGNIETYDNPYFRYLNIKPPRKDGIYTFKNGSVAVEVIAEGKQYGQKQNVLQDVLLGTEYGAYMFDGKAKVGGLVKIGKPPRKASFYCAFDFGRPFTIFRHKQYFYVRETLDKTRPIFVDVPRAYKRAIRISSRDRARFGLIERAVKYGRIFYDSERTAENANAVFIKLCVIK